MTVHMNMHVYMHLFTTEAVLVIFTARLRNYDTTDFTRGPA
jgi:hypothetical protein